MTAVIYARFSSDRQREESIEGQLRECHAYAEKHEISVLDVYVDRAKSASKDTDKRESFQRMIRDSSKGLFEIVLVWKLDRFARSRYDSAHFKHILKKNGVKVVSATENITEGPEGIILESMLEGMAEYYSAELSEKVRRGQTENALKGRRNGGQTPFGYRLADHRLQPDPATAPVVLEIFQRYAEGETIRELAEDLNKRGIRTRRGNLFTYSSFSRALRNRTYVGEFHYRDTVVQDVVPAIIPQELFDRVQFRLEKNKRTPSATKAEERYLLTTKIFCGECGNLMVGESGVGRSGKLYRYYKCNHAKRKKGCTKKAVPKDWIENLVVQYAMMIVMDDDLIARLAQRVYETQGNENFAVSLLEKELSDVEKSIGNILSAIEGGLFTPSMKERLTALEEQKKQVEASIAQEKLTHPPLTLEGIVFFLQRFRKTDVSSEAERRQLIDHFVKAVVVYDDKILLTFNYTTDNMTTRLAEGKEVMTTILGSIGSGPASVGPPRPGIFGFQVFFYIFWSRFFFGESKNAGS